MLIRRCAVLYLEPREDLGIDWTALFSGQGALGAAMRWVALAPHLEREVDVDAGDVAALGAIGQSLWLERDGCEQRHGVDVIARLLAQGLLVADVQASEAGDQAQSEPGESAKSQPDSDPDSDPGHVALVAWRARDELLRSQHWRPLSAVAHIFSRWDDMRAETGMRFPSFEELVDNYGQPPPLAIERCADALALRLPLPAPAMDPVQVPGPESGTGPATLDAILARRYTGRNFDRDAVLPLATASRLLRQSFGAQAEREMAPGSFVLKKNVPSAGGLHPVEAYVLAQRVDGVAPGLYHYHPVKHALEPIAAMDTAQTAALALRAVADQEWFVDAPMLVVLAARVERNFWKYRNHAKAYRALMLDAGHLSQTFYLLATEAGMPAFITAAINEGDIERAFGLDPLTDAVLGVCGCGPASGREEMLELRPQPQG